MKKLVAATIFILIIINGGGKGIHQKSIPVGYVEYKPINHAPVALINVSKNGKNTHL